MSEMIERVAKAIYGGRKQYYGAHFPEPLPWEDAGEPIRKIFRALARAAIEAMREPTFEMRRVSSFTAAEIDWPAMIDAALALPAPLIGEEK